MKFLSQKSNIKLAAFALTSITLGGSLASCEGIYDYEGDCSVTYEVGIKFTRNILDANAFSSKVNSVTVLVYNTSGNLVYHNTEAGETLKNDDYTMAIDVQPGTYDILVWGGLEDGNSFLLNNGALPTTLSDAICEMQRETTGDMHISKNMLSPLFHGMAKNVVIEDNDEIGIIRVANIDLTKDTNTIRVMLTHNNEELIDPDNFSFSITDSNGKLNYDNSLLNDHDILYREHTKYDLPTVSFDEQGTRATVTVTNSMMAEMDMSRLMADRNPRLVINRSDSEEPVLSLPLTQLLLHAKGEAKKSMDDQEYLDRQDEYTLVFFLNDDNGWNLSAGIYINGWHMRYQSSDL